MSGKAIIIFAKKPEVGHVKTRLAKSIGETRALQVYEKLLWKTHSNLQSVPYDKLLYWDQIPQKLPEYLMEGYKFYEQVFADLGHRMSKAFEETFTYYNKVLIIGTDCPFITPDIVESAFEMLDENDFVLGPARDGGYYLLGKKYYEPNIFVNIKWSTSEVLSETIHKIQSLNKRFGMLPELYDIDSEPDLIYWENLKEY